MAEARSQERNFLQTGTQTRLRGGVSSSRTFQTCRLDLPSQDSTSIGT